MMKRSLFLLLFLTSSLTQAQDMFQEYLYSADLVMKNRDKISLSDTQADKIKKIHSTNAADFSTLKWDLDAATEKLKKLLEQPKPDAAAVSRQMDEVLELENQLKKKQLTTLVAIKNELTESQQSELKKTKVMGRVTSWEYAPGGTTATFPQSSFQYRISKESPTATINGTTRVYGTDKSTVYIQSPNSPESSPAYYIKKDTQYMKVPSVSEIKPEDIESIEVWKGEKAIEKFGQNGKNGAIIITLKQKPGDAPLEF
ncbi:periplasmic heavy metal sensor [Algoriphagus lacus]|uniref:Periplasmic heavy metal sensor n=1 Tax=Algoriphagus lacus TaxID=2056311 RepID=A0A418PWV6_9BACT|nr:periplasmic heavy metal sensor [Algoriphagus lacus]RIW18684.1 periplasmic heavy metal sensor [Algoriphagus lacus]